MQAIEYDLNITGGLMPQINALTAPPSSDDTNRRRKLKKSIARQNQLNSDSNSNLNNYNRPILSRQTKTGKAPNHEYCDSCREGGDLLCCDRCPNAFHLQCHDPPLDEEDVPQGEWLCRKCEIGDEEMYISEDSESEDVESNPKAFQKPFSLLIRAAQTLNPKQFQLPNDMVPSIPLVGSSKKVNNNNKNSMKKPIPELDNNFQASFPIQLCFQCSKSCRKAPLIQCDYCPLLFHPDCLDPPLTALPTGRWMCPNHSQHVVEQKLLDSESLSERIKLWNHFNGPISQDTVKMNFLKKIHRTNPPYRTKLVMPQSPKVIVPQAIKDMYKTRPPLLPTLYDPISLNKYYSNQTENQFSYEKPTPEQEREWLEAMTAFQLSAAQYLNSMKSDETKTKKEADTSDKEIESKVNISAKFNSQTMNGPTDIHSEDSSHEKSKNSGPKTEAKLFNGDKEVSPVISERKISIKNNASINTVEDLTKHFDETTIKLLALQRLQQINNKHNDNINSPSVTHPVQNISTTPPTPYQTSIRRIGLHDVRARAVLCPIVHVKGTNTSITEYSLMSYRTLTIGTSSENDVVLGDYGHCNFVSTKHACIFYDESSRTYELINYSEHGTTVDNVLYSCDFSDKKVQSVKHSNLNSQTVNTVKTVANKRKKKVAVDRRVKNEQAEDVSSDKRQTKRRKSLKGEETEGNAQKLYDFKTSKITFRWDHDSENVERVVSHNKNPLRMSSKSGQSSRPCACKSSCSSLIGANGAGWEGTAILHHGSHIKIGCHQFIFSITNHSIPNQNQTNNQSKSPIKAEPTVKPIATEK